MNLQKKINPRFLIASTFNLLILSVPLYFRFVNEELFEFNKIILVYTFTIIIGFLWLFRMLVEKKIILKHSFLDIPLAFFVTSQFISTIFSIHPYTSLFGYYSRFNGGFLSTLSYVFLFYAFISNIKKSDLGGFLLSSFISGLLISIYGIFEHFGHSFSCLLLSTYKKFDVNCWIQDVQSRVYASFGQPNWLAAYVITLFPLPFVASLQKNLSPIKRIFFIITTLSLFLVLLYTRSRSGILGLSIGFITFGLGTSIIYLKDKKKLLKNIKPIYLLIMVTSIIVMALVNGTSFTPSVSEILKSKDNSLNLQVKQEMETTKTPVNRLDQGGTDSGEIRKIVWTGAFKVWQRYPIIGSGVETFAYSYYKDRIREHNDVSEWDFLYNKAHNELLNYLATTGILGLITYLSLFITITIATSKVIFSKNHSQTEKLIVLALISGQIALFVSNFFGFSTVGVNVLMYLFFAITSIIYANEKNDEEDKKNNKRTNFVIKNNYQYFGIIFGAFVCLILLLNTYNYWVADKSYAEGKNHFDAGDYQYGILKIQEAIRRSPKEALYYDTISNNYAELAAHFASTNEATLAAKLSEDAIAASNKVMELNDKHINFYKSRNRMMIILSQIDNTYIEEAKKTLLKAIELAPTDPKLIYTLAVLEQNYANDEEALKLYSIATKLKPNYEKAYIKISEIYQSQEKYDQAIKPLEYVLKNISPNNAEVTDKITTLQEKIQNQK